MNGTKIKIMLLLVVVFVFGGAAAVMQYAYGGEVLEKNENMFMVSHTEYRYGEAGQIVVRLVDFSGGAIAVDNCTATILYPNKTIYLGPSLMSATGTITGDHYYSFTTPSGPEGIYEYQATCTYATGTKVKSATNSFHLSSAFNQTITGIETTLANLAAVNSTVVAFRNEVQANFSQVQASIASINVTGAVSNIAYTLGQVNTTVNSIDSNLNQFIIDTQASLAGINTTVVDNLALSTVINSTVNGIKTDIATLNTTMSVRFDAVDLAIADGTAAMAANVSDLRSYVSAVNDSIIAAINGINVNVNLTPVFDAISNVNSTLLSKMDAVNLSISSSIADFRQEVQANFSDVLDAIGAITIPDYSAILNQINATTVSTYDYITGTMASNINDALTALGVINATVNRIEQKTDVINTTTKQILQNQEDEVFINTYSG